MAGITKGHWIAVGAMVENTRDDIADICSCNPASFGQDGPNLKPRSYAEMAANAKAIAAIPAMLEALKEARQWIAKGVADGAYDGCVAPLAPNRWLERCGAILSRIDGAGDTLPDAPAPTGDARLWAGPARNDGNARRIRGSGHKPDFARGAQKGRGDLG